MKRCTHTFKFDGFCNSPSSTQVHIIIYIVLPRTNGPKFTRPLYLPPFPSTRRSTTDVTTSTVTTRGGHGLQWQRTKERES
jgi:hypothetical protein